MTWARPDLLALLLLVPAVLVGVIFAERARRRLLGMLVAIESFPLLGIAGVLRARALQAALAVIATLALALAAAGPRLGFEWQQQSLEGVSIVVVLDVSRSMDAQDVSPSRIERARREILDFVSLLRGDSVGLVIFAAGPYVRIPLTVDYDTFLWALNDSSSDTIRAQGTSLAGALDAATGLLERADGSGKAVLVVSDGEGHDASAELDAALERARSAGVRIYALGVGQPEGAPIPIAEGGFKKDSAGGVVLSRLDESALQRLAAATGGAYVRAVSSDDDVRGLYVNEIRGKLEAAERGVRRDKLWHERYQWPLGVALCALVLTSLLGVRPGWRRGVANGAALLGFVFLLGAPRAAWAGAEEDGRSALQRGEWARAAELLGQARVQDPSDIGVSQALAEALYRGGRYREAEQLFETLAEADPEHKAVHLYNAGNAAYRGGRLGEALTDFRSAAGADPELKPAQGNASAVEREIAARTSPPPPEDDEGQGGDQGESGEQDGQASSDGAQQDAQPSDQQGEPQDGEQGSSGQEGTPGEQQGGEQQAGGDQGGEQAGDQQAGEAGDTQPPADGSAPGETADARDAAGQQQGGSAGADDKGQREGDAAGEGAAGGVEGEDGQTALGGEGDEGGGGDIDAPDASAGAPGGMSREQAARLVDSVPDGTPRVVVGGRDTEKDW